MTPSAQPLNLLVVSNLYPPIAIGGYEQVCFDVVEGLRARGHRVSVLTSCLDCEDVRHPEEGVFRLLKIRSSWNYSRASRSRAAARSRLEVDWHNARTIRRVIRELNASVVVFFNGGSMGRALIGMAERSSRVVYRLSDTWLVPMMRPKDGRERLPLRNRLYQLTLRALGVPLKEVSGDHLIFCSNALRAEFHDMGIDASEGTVIYPGVPVGLFRARPAHILRRPAGEPQRILYVGRVCWEKGVHTLVRALAQVRSTGGLERTRLSLLGVIQDEAYGAKLRRLIGELGVEEAVDFLEPRPRAEVPSAYWTHDVLAFPSEWKEPFGLTLLEAMAAGMPVVTSVRGGPAEIAVDRENCRTFEAGHAEDLNEKLTWMFDHPEAAAKLGARASEDVNSHYTLTQYVESIERYLQAAAL